MKLQINSMVVFDPNTVAEEYRAGKWYNQYYKYHEGKTYIYLGEIVQCPEHCILVDMDTGKVECMFHTENFRQLTEDEV